MREALWLAAAALVALVYLNAVALTAIYTVDHDYSPILLINTMLVGAAVAAVLTVFCIKRSVSAEQAA